MSNQITVLIRILGSGVNCMSTINFFATANVYGGNWKVIETREFNPQEKGMVEKAVIKDAEHGLSVCFFMKEGGSTYISLGKESSGFVGQEVSMDDLKLLTLERRGQQCTKVIIDK